MISIKSFNRIDIYLIIIDVLVFLISRRIPFLGLEKIVMYLQNNSADRHVFDNADTALNLLTIYSSEAKMGSSLSIKSADKPGQGGF